jgi:subtilisin-like proprotein convertase family protein
MLNPNTHLRLRPNILRLRLFTLLSLAIAGIFLTSTQSPGISRAAKQDSTQSEAKLRRQERQPGYRSASEDHKLRVLDPSVARELKERGARLIADYGSFQVFSADSQTAQEVSSNESVEWRDEDNLILLNSGPIDTSKREVQQLRIAHPSAPISEGSLHLIQFAGPIKPEWYKALSNTGVSIVTYIPNNAYLVYGDGRDLERLRAWAARASSVQWDGEYEDRFKIAPDVYESRQANKNGPGDDHDDLFAVQLVSDGAGNVATMQLIAALKTENIRSQFRVLNYINLIVKLPRQAVEKQIARRPDVVSVMRYIEPVKFDERQNIIMTGNLVNNQPASGDYLAYLASNGLTQGQFTASGFAINISDSGVDNGTASPNHFGLFVSGDTAGQSRLIYNRLEGTPNAGSTIQGCDGHGNLNAHIIAGFVPSSFVFFPHVDSSGFRYGLGVAPFVKVGSSVIFDPNTFTFPNYNNLESKAYNDGARISSNSWGANIGGAYNIDAQAYDALVRDAQPTGSTFPAPGNQQMVIVFAAGNQGPVSSSIGAPGTAKNVITVGAAENVQSIGGTDACNINDSGANNANEMADFSSRGPTLDGRKKPDIVAPGTHVSGGVAQIASPPSNGQANPCYTGGGVCGGPSSSIFFPVGQQFYTASSGTSHSTPAAAGAAALVRQRFINASQPPPSPAMTKAALMQTARYMTGANANDTLWSNVQGMGEVNLTSFFNLFNSPTILRDQVVAETFTATGQVRAVPGTIVDSSKPFRVTLAWTDAPGPTSGNAFVNDLDLEVTVGGQTYFGNVFSGAFSAPGGSPDARNNVESVFIPAGVNGSFVVRIKATNIAGDGVPNSGGPLDQDYAIVISNAVETAQPVLTGANSPIATESCAPGNNAIDPGETVTVNFALQNIGTQNTNNLVATLQSGGGVINPSAPQTYGEVLAGGAPVSKPFTFTAGGVCGGALIATLSLQDGSSNLGTVNFTFNLGTAITNNGTFSNTTPITIPAGAPGTTSGAASIYPSTINVSGLIGTVSKVTVTLTNLSHTFPDDLDMLLVSPSGQKILLMSDAGGDGDVNNINLTFDDTATQIPDTTTLTSGTYGPGNFGGLSDTFPSPAPAGPYPDPQRLSAFNGASPNGLWSLFIVDDGDDDVGSIQGGWSLNITTTTPACCSSTGCSTITVNPPSLSSGVAGDPYTQTFSQIGGTPPVGFGVTGALPQGLSLAGATLSGTPTQIGNFNFTITAVDSQGCIGNRNYTLAISCPPITINPQTLPEGRVGTAYSQALTASGGVNPLSFASAGGLPAGLTLSSAGLFSGTPSQQGSFTFSVIVTDANGCTGTANYTLLIRDRLSNLQYYALPRPIRLLDTRPGESACFAPGLPLGDNAVSTQQARVTCDGITIPADAQAIVGNATVVNFISTGFHWITLYPSDAAQPNASNLNFSDNQIAPNNFTVGLGPDGAFKIYSHASTHFIVDITGYYAPPGTGGLFYHPLPNPVRLLDTRPGQTACDAPGAPLGDDATRAVTAHGACAGATIPTTAKAIVGNATVVNFISSGFNWITLYPFGTTQPNVSNLNFTANQIVPNWFVMGLSNDGKFNIYSRASTHFVVDVAGYFSDEPVDANGVGLLYTALPTPVRLLETRPGEQGCDAPGVPLGDDATREQTAHRTCFGVTVPATAKAVVGNATVVNFISSGFNWITLYPFGVPQPLASNLNFTANQIVPNAFWVGLSNDGRFNIYSRASTHFIVDLTGYFAP